MSLASELSALCARHGIAGADCAAGCPARRQLADLVSALTEEADYLEHKVPRRGSEPTVASLRCARLIRRVLAVNAAHHGALMETRQ